MRIGMHVNIPITAPMEKWTRFVTTADQAGIAHLGVGEIQTQLPESYIHLAMIALNTKNVRMGPIISNPVTRHPGVAASAFATLQRISGGRVFLGVGTGNSSLRQLGLRPARLEHLSEYVRVFRALIKDGSAVYQGKTCILPWAPKVVPQGVPVYMAAHGPKSLYLAGQIADGVFVAGGISREVTDLALTSMEAGARSVGRKLDDIDVWFQVDMNVAKSDVEAVDQMRDILTGISTRNLRETLPKELREAVQAVAREWSSKEHGSYTLGQDDLLAKYGLKEYFVRRWLVAGTPDTVVKRLKELRSYGIRQLQITGMVPDPTQLVSELRDRILPRLRDS